MNNKIDAFKLQNFLGDFIIDEKDVIERKAIASQMVIDPNDGQTAIVKMTTNTVDRDGDILIPSGCNYADYMKNPVCLWQHAHSQPAIGKVLNMQVTPNAIYGKVKFAETTLAQEVWSLVKGGFITSCSIGFICRKVLIRGTAAFKEYVQQTGLQITNEVKRIITEYVLIENSFVNIPANQEALVLAVSNKSIHLSEKLMDDFNIKNVVEAPVAEVVPEPSKAPETVVETIVKNDPEPVPVVAEPVVVPEPVPEPVKVWTVIRNGPLVPDGKMLETAKAFKSGKIV